MPGEIILSITEKGEAQIVLREIDGGVLLTQAQLPELCQATNQNISLHIGHILVEGELAAEVVVKEHLTTASDGKAYRTLH